MLRMNCGILLLVVVLVEVQHAYTTGKHFSKEKEEQSKLLRRHYNECMEETRVSPNIVHRIRHGDWSHSDAPPAHEWALCVLVKSGLMTKEGVYKMDKPFSEIATEEKRRVEKLVDKCLPTKAYPSPVIAYKFMRCFSSKKTPYLETVAALIRDH